MCWRLILKEFGPELKYIKCENNALSDALYCLEMSNNQDILNISELYGYDNEDLPDSAYPIRYHDISKAQRTDAKLQQKLVSQKDYTLDTFRGGDKNHRLIFGNKKYAYLRHYKRKLYIGITRWSFIQDRLEHSIPSVNILTVNAFAQQSMTCVRSS